MRKGTLYNYHGIAKRLFLSSRYSGNALFALTRVIFPVVRELKSMGMEVIVLPEMPWKIPRKKTDRIDAIPGDCHDMTGLHGSGR